MNPVFYSEIDNYRDFLNIKEKADNGHIGAKQLYDKLKNKYDKPRYVFLYENWHLENLRHRAVDLHQYRAALAYRRYLENENIKNEYEEIKKLHGEQHAREMIWILYKKRINTNINSNH